MLAKAGPDEDPIGTIHLFILVTWNVTWEFE